MNCINLNELSFRFNFEQLIVRFNIIAQSSIGNSNIMNYEIYLHAYKNELNLKGLNFCFSKFFFFLFWWICGSNWTWLFEIQSSGNQIVKENYWIFLIKKKWNKICIDFSPVSVYFRVHLNGNSVSFFLFIQLVTAIWIAYKCSIRSNKILLSLWPISIGKMLINHEQLNEKPHHLMLCLSSIGYGKSRITKIVLILTPRE